MIDIVRIVEDQASLSSYRATQDEEKALQLELLIESTKPNNAYCEWHTLIATPFRYNPPHPAARFRPSYGKNIFYGSKHEETALYEHAFHFMRERIHLNIKSDSGLRTLFYVAANDQDAFDIKNIKSYKAIINRDDYTASHEFILENKKVNFILYPSCRDPKHRENSAILNIKLLNKTPKWISPRKYFFDGANNEITWIDYNLKINWITVK